MRINTRLTTVSRQRYLHDPRHVTCNIASTTPNRHVRSLPEAQYIPSNSLLAGASHLLRVWVRSQTRHHFPIDDTLSYIYQRIWKIDALKIGSKLSFASLGSRVTMGLPLRGGPETDIRRIAANVIRLHSGRLTRRERAVAIPPPSISLSGFTTVCSIPRFYFLTLIIWVNWSGLRS